MHLQKICTFSSQEVLHFKEQQSYRQLSPKKALKLSNAVIFRNPYFVKCKL